jgi:hypothetical protein
LRIAEVDARARIAEGALAGDGDFAALAPQIAVVPETGWLNLNML